MLAHLRETNKEGGLVHDITREIQPDDAIEIFRAAVMAFRQGAAILLKEFSETKVSFVSRPARGAEYTLSMTFTPSEDPTDFRPLYEFAKAFEKTLPRTFER
jgi:hypothetical protein